MSFIGFVIFYSEYIPFFEFRIMELRKLTTLPCDTILNKRHLTEEVLKEMTAMKTAILSDPLLARLNRDKRQYLKTDFCKLGFGFVVLQSGDDEKSIKAMEREIAGGPCEFDISKAGPRLRPCSFGSKKLASYQQYLHSSYGEGLALKYGINKNHHILFRVEFTAITDCWDLEWIM